MSQISGFEYQIDPDNKYFDPQGIKEILKSLYVDERFLKRIDDAHIAISVKFREPIILGGNDDGSISVSDV